MATDLKTAPVMLGGREFLVCQLPYKRLKKFVPLLTKTAGALVGGMPVAEGDFDAMLAAIQIGLVDQGVTIEYLEDLPIAPAELGAAVKAIAELSGLNQKAGDPNVGAQPTAGTGTTSTPT
jgi:hypothetical protein